MYGGRRWNGGNANRFENYREVSAKFASVGACGHDVQVGDRIGYHRLHGAQCADCWERWVSENAEADRMEGAFTGYER